MTINEFIMKYREVDQRDYRGTELEYSYEDGVMTMIRNPCVVCKDGFTFRLKRLALIIVTQKDMQMNILI